MRGSELVLTESDYAEIELVPTCDVCGHILCTENHEEKEKITDNTT